MDSTTIVVLLALGTCVQLLLGALARMDGDKNAFRASLAGVFLLTSGLVAAGFQNVLLPWVSQGTGPLTIIAGSFLISLAVSRLSGGHEKKFQTRLGFGAVVACAVAVIFSAFVPGWIWIMTAFASTPFFLIAGIFLLEEKNRSLLKTVAGIIFSSIAALLLLAAGLKTAGFEVGILRRSNVLLALFAMEQTVWAVLLLLFNDANGVRLAQVSTHDALTGLYNLKGFSEETSKALSMCARHNIAYSLFMFDIDHFRKINDELGHLAGNQILMDFAHRLSSRIRVYDILCRTNGDEFMLFLQSVDHEKIEPVMKRLCGGFSYQTEEGIRYSVSVSVTTVDHPAGRAVRFEELLAAGSQGLLAAKQQGGARLEHVPF